MKTDTETLRKRGFLTNTEAEPYFLYSKEELLELLKDKTAVNRTAALFILRSFVDINELDEILLRMLVKEKALYTKLQLEVINIGRFLKRYQRKKAILCHGILLLELWLK